MFNNHLPMNHLRASRIKYRLSFLLSPASCVLGLESCVLFLLASTTVGDPLQIGPIMQNKPNFKIGKMNVSIAITKHYASEQRTIKNERYSKQTQTKPNTKPNKPNSPEAKMSTSSTLTRDYENQPLRSLPENKPNTNPISISHVRPNPCLSRSVSCLFCSAVCWLRGSALPFPFARAASPAAINSSRQRYNVFCEIPYRRASTVAGFSRCNSDSTTLRPSGTLKSDFDPIFQFRSIFLNPTH